MDVILYKLVEIYGCLYLPAIKILNTLYDFLPIVQPTALQGSRRKFSYCVIIDF
jgi:hypothetical protein